MTPEQLAPLYLAIAGLVLALPPIVDAWLAMKIAAARLLALATMGVALVDSLAAAGLTQLAQGSTFKMVASTFAAGLAVGALTTLVNWLKGSTPAGGQGASGGSAGSSGGNSPKTTGALMRGVDGGELHVSGMWSAARGFGIAAAVAGVVLVASQLITVKPLPCATNATVRVVAAQIAPHTEGCALFTPAKVADVATITECVLANESMCQGGITLACAAQIAERCALEDAQQVIDILAAHKAAEHREGMRAPDAGAE